MPRETNIISDEERATRIRETAKEIGTSNDPKDFERAFAKIVSPKLTEAPETVEKRKAKKR